MPNEAIRRIADGYANSPDTTDARRARRAAARAEALEASRAALGDGANLADTVQRLTAAGVHVSTTLRLQAGFQQIDKRNRDEENNQ
ncbi:MAG: hypothetical protein M3Q22_10085 [Actinomycetota bacterium]|nr:hypothetical protein [Actinomycetota bacterium]